MQVHSYKPGVSELTDKEGLDLVQTSRRWTTAVPLSAEKDAVVKRGVITDATMAASRSMLKNLI